MLSPALCPRGQLVWPVPIPLTSLASKAGSHMQTPTGSGPRSVATPGLCPVTQLSETKTMAEVIQQCCVTGQCVPLLGNIPSTALPISLETVNDYSRHEKNCCHICSARMVLSSDPVHLVSLHRWCVWSDQGASTSCVHWNSSSMSHKSSSVSKGRRANSSSCNYLPKLIPLQFQSAALDIPSSGCNPSS